MHHFAAERVAHRRPGYKAGRHAHKFGDGELHGQIVEAAAGAVAFIHSAGGACFGAIDEGKVGTYIPEESQGVGSSVGRRVHRVDLPTGVHRISYAAHLALGGGSVVVENTVAIHGIWRGGLSGSADCRGGAD